MSRSPCFSRNACVELGETRFVSSSWRGRPGARRGTAPPRRRETRAHMNRPAYLEYGVSGPIEQHLARLRRQEQKLLNSSTSSPGEVEDVGWQIELLDALPSRGAVMSVAELGEISSASRVTGQLKRQKL